MPMVLLESDEANASFLYPAGKSMLGKSKGKSMLAKSKEKSILAKSKGKSMLAKSKGKSMRAKSKGWSDKITAYSDSLDAKYTAPASEDTALPPVAVSETPPSATVPEKKRKRKEHMYAFPTEMAETLLENPA